MTCPEHAHGQEDSRTPNPNREQTSSSAAAPNSRCVQLSKACPDLNRDGEQVKKNRLPLRQHTHRRRLNPLSLLSCPVRELPQTKPKPNRNKTPSKHQKETESACEGKFKKLEAEPFGQKAHQLLSPLSNRETHPILSCDLSLKRNRNMHIAHLHWFTRNGDGLTV